MKKTTYILVAALLAVITIFSACKKDSTPEQFFTFDLATGAGYISRDVTLATGQPFKVGIIALSSTDNTLTHLLITRTFETKPDIIFDSALNLTALTYDFNWISRAEPGVETWVFTITESTGSSLLKTFNITTESTTGPIITYDQRILGAQQNPIGPAFSSATGEVYDLANGKINATSVDWLYYFGTASFATITSPDNNDATKIFTDGGTVEDPGPNALLTWSIRNATRFITITDTVNWDEIQDDTELIALSQGAFESAAIELQPDFYVAFITGAGKRGLIRINEIAQEEDGTIDISVKVQQ